MNSASQQPAPVLVSYDDDEPNLVDAAIRATNENHAAAREMARMRKGWWDFAARVAAECGWTYEPVRASHLGRPDFDQSLTDGRSRIEVLRRGGGWWCEVGACEPELTVSGTVAGLLQNYDGKRRHCSERAALKTAAVFMRMNPRKKESPNA